MMQVRAGPIAASGVARLTADRPPANPFSTPREAASRPTTGHPRQEMSEGYLPPLEDEIGTSGRPGAGGLFDPALERDSCGVGFIANLKGYKSHAIVAG